MLWCYEPFDIWRSEPCVLQRFVLRIRVLEYLYNTCLRPMAPSISDLSQKYLTLPRPRMREEDFLILESWKIVLNLAVLCWHEPFDIWRSEPCVLQRFVLRIRVLEKTRMVFCVVVWFKKTVTIQSTLSLLWIVRFVLNQTLESILCTGLPFLRTLTNFLFTATCVSKE